MKTLDQCLIEARYASVEAFQAEIQELADEEKNRSGRVKLQDCLMFLALSISGILLVKALCEPAIWETVQ